MIDYSDAPLFSREKYFKRVLEELNKIKNPVIIEIGCIRSIDDTGAGNSSELFAWYVSKYGGTFITVDIDINNLQLCKSVIEKYSNDKCSIQFSHSDGLQFLKNTDVQADLLYLDGLDAEPDCFIESALFHFDSFLVYEDKLKDGSIILIDDNLNDNFHGKGYVLIPHLLMERKLECLVSGYQYGFIYYKENIC